MSFLPKNWGTYPPEYNREIHGPYNPSVYYGKRDTPFGDVKLGELAGWFGRRRKTPRAIAQALSRAWFRYQIAWVSPKKPGAAFFYHYIAVAATISFFLSYEGLQNEIQYRFH